MSIDTFPSWIAKNDPTRAACSVGSYGHGSQHLPRPRSSEAEFRTRPRNGAKPTKRNTRTPNRQNNLNRLARCW
jgi:hypothetical protein